MITCESCQPLLLPYLFDLVDDAEREPKIKERGSPIVVSAEETASGKEEPFQKRCLEP